MPDKILNLIFFHLIFISFVFSTLAKADQEKEAKELRKEIVKEILKTAPELKIGAPAISDEHRKQLEDPELSRFIKEFCPRMNYLTLKTKWETNTKIYNQRMELVKKDGAQAVKWRTPNLGQNSFSPFSSARFEGVRSQQISVPSLQNLKVFLDQRLREIYPHCDFTMTRKPQFTGDKIIHDRRLYLKDLSMSHPENVLDSEMIELKLFDPIQAADRKSIVFINVTAHGYKIRFQAPGKNIIKSPVKLVFSVKILKSGFFLRDMQELNPDSGVALPSSEIQRAQMDSYAL
ncbi:MAG: hypothetical protein AABY64_10670 [Bdellovibrionota bacterium]